MAAAAKKQIECPRCDGTGYIKAYGHVADGICFKCEGTGKVNAPRPRKATAPKTWKTQDDIDMIRQWQQQCITNNPIIWTSPLMRNADPNNPVIGMKLTDTYLFHEKFGWGEAGMAEAEKRVR